MNETRQFDAISRLVWLAIMCVVALGALIIFKNVTKDNSFGVDGIVETMKSTLSMLIGALTALAKQSSSPNSITIPPANENGKSSTTVITAKEPSA